MVLQEQISAAYNIIETTFFRMFGLRSMEYQGLPKNKDFLGFRE